MKAHATNGRVLAVAGAALFSAVLLGGCGSSVKATYAPTFQPVLGTTVRMGAVIDAAPLEDRGDKQDFDIEHEMRRQLEKHLRQAGLLASAATSDRSVDMSVTIGKYEPGNAFARWLIPGLGATKLSIECTLREGNQEVGTITVDRVVAVGGAYTISEWEEVFGDVAKNVVMELKKKLKS